MRRNIKRLIFSGSGVLILPADRSLRQAVKALSFCHVVRERWPEMEVHAGYYRETQKVVFEHCSDIRAAVPFANLKVNKPRHWQRTLRSAIPVWRALCGYQTIVLLHERDSHWPMKLLSQLTGATVITLRADSSMEKIGVLRQIEAVAGRRNDSTRSLPRPSIAVGADQQAYARAFLNK